MFIFAAAPADVNPTPAVSFDLLADVADDFRPTAGPDFIPTAEEDAEAAELLNDGADEEPTDAEWDARADEAYALDVVSSGIPWL